MCCLGDPPDKQDFMRTLAIGDIHGASTALDALLAAVRPTPDDRLVFLGDYVDRGPDTKGVLDRLIQLRTTHTVVCLRGNHEVMMTQARTAKAERKMWLSVGGTQALASYGKAPGLMGKLDDVPPEHWSFLEDHLADWFETETHLFVHAGLHPELPMDEQSDLMLFWEFLNPHAPYQHVSGKTVICGHTSQRSGKVLDLGTTICIDTHAYGGGWLTCLDVHALRYWQADVMGRVREDWLEPRGE